MFIAREVKPYPVSWSFRFSRQENQFPPTSKILSNLFSVPVADPIDWLSQHHNFQASFPLFSQSLLETGKPSA